VPSSEPEPRSGFASSTPSTPYSSNLPGVEKTTVLNDLVRVAPTDDGLVLIAFVRDGFGTLEAQASDVTQWCAETSVLIGVTFELTPGDEVSVRTPMLVGRRGALAVVRQVTNEGSKVVVATAASATELANERYASAIDLTLDDARSLVMALESAARSAMSSRANP
jgi:hypothetical protein